jgi:hypothetical protein
METNVGRGLSPPAGRTKCQPTMLERWLVAFLVDALPEIVVDADTIRDDKAPTATKHAAPMMRAPTGLRSRDFIAFPCYCSEPIAAFGELSQPAESEPLTHPVNLRHPYP